MFRVLDLKLHNFKGFKDAVITFNSPRTVLGGPNGYGKTSVFDALELLFTGSILRMKEYSPGHDKRTNLNPDYKPLVYDTSIADISIEATIQLPGKEQLRVRRCAEQNRMRNPVDFEAFSKIQYFDCKSGMYKDCDTNPSFSGLFSSMAAQYSFMNYLSQEEANRFLKCSEQERKRQINSLFQTQAFDQPIDKLTLVRSEVKEEVQIIDDDITQLKQVIEQLQALPIQEVGGITDAEYIKLFDTDFDWDRDNPRLSYESYNSILKEGGVLDDLLYYAKLEPTYKWFQTNNSLNEIQKPDILDGLALWLRWKDEEATLFEYEDYSNVFRKSWEELSLSTIMSFSFDVPNSLPDGVLANNTLSEMNRLLSSLKLIVKSTGDLQRLYADLVGSRDGTERTLVDTKSIVKITDCPLCGRHYETEEALIKDVQMYGVRLRKSLNEISDGISSMVEDFKKQVRELVVIPIESHYHSLGIGADVVRAYLKLNKYYYADLYAFLEQQLSFHLETVNDQEATKQLISNAIDKWQNENAQELPADFDLKRMQRIQNSYWRYLLPGVLSKESIDKKRRYLTNAWNTSVSQLMNDTTSKISELQIQHKRLTNLEKVLKRTIDKIKIQRNSYLSTMVSQIETLFYIYTGRIMQDNFYGRGCFLKYNEKNSVVLFTSGSFNNDVDALYKMSSGQLVGISIAFLLTINKLYADNAIIAIDDPIQTIDDLNVWGLMETLRHDFMESSVLLSTHERDYGQLLTAKFRKVGLDTEYFDMSTLHTGQEGIHRKTA